MFSRVDSTEWQWTNLKDNLNDSLKIAKFAMGKDIEVVKTFADIPEILCKGSQINQVFLNILLNAVQAIDKTGKINIETIYKENDNIIIVEISDTGCGMEQKELDKIFDPFFTTKDPGSGTGMGLSISDSIIREHRGNIKVKSKKGKGTKFIITLPVSSR